VISSYDLIQEALSKRKSIFEEEGAIRQGYPWNY
jgi:hypothetical protein